MLGSPSNGSKGQPFKKFIHLHLCLPYHKFVKKVWVVYASYFEMKCAYFIYHGAGFASSSCSVFSSLKKELLLGSAKTLLFSAENCT